MKAKVLSLLIPALLSAGAVHAAEIYNKNANKLDLYGKVSGLHYFSKDNDNNGSQTYARLSFKGETQISSELTGFGRWEAQFNANKAESDNTMRTRYAYVGLQFANLGLLDYGRNTGVVYDVTSYTDMLPEFGGDTYGTENFLQSRMPGALTYRNRNFFGLVTGLNFALQYVGKSESGDVLKQNGDAFGMSATYDIGATGLSVAAAMSSSNLTADQNKLTRTTSYDHGDRAEVYAAGIKYDANQVYLAVHYKQTHNATRFGDSKSTATDAIYGLARSASIFEAVVQYNFGFGLTPSLAYLQSKGHSIRNSTKDYGDQDLLKYVDIGATYNFNKNMSAYVDYKINLLKDTAFVKNSGTQKDNIVAMGVVYQF